MIAGFEQPTSGRIFVAGRDVSGVPPHKRPVNMVFQNYALFPHLTVFENVAFGLKATKSTAAAEIPERVKWALNLVRLGGFGERYPRQISGGQAQRVALARAVANRPTVLLLDEPLSALDLKIRQEMQDELARLQRELGITFIMVTHDQGEALALSGRIAVFAKGNLEQLGTPREIYERPATRFVAEFIGQTNVFEGCVTEMQGPFSRVRLGDDFYIWVNDERKPRLAGANVAVWLRTQSVKFVSADGATPAEAGDAQPVNRLTAVVVGKSYQGGSTDYRLQLQDNVYWKASCANGSDRGFQVGQSVHLFLPANLANILPEPSSGSKTQAAPAGAC